MEDEYLKKIHKIELRVAEMGVKVDILPEIASDIKEMVNAQNNMRIELEQLKVKAGIWGAAAGAIPVIIALFIAFFKRFI